MRSSCVHRRRLKHNCTPAQETLPRRRRRGCGCRAGGCRVLRGLSRLTMSLTRMNRATRTRALRPCCLQTSSHSCSTALVSGGFCSCNDILTKEVTELHSRFEAELARQAAKAAEAAKQAAAALSGPLAKRTDRSKQATRTSGGKNTTTSIDGQKGNLEQSLLGTKGKGGKKKKRSALANASNPHHLRNYVPSRLPHSGPPSAQQAVQNAQNLLTPLPLRFLSAEIPPRRRKKREEQANTVVAAPPVANLTNPGDEWICPFCEYELFYGEEQSYTRAVRNRKKILRRRRRARERAAAAASGVAAPAAGSERTEEEEHAAGFENAAPAKEGGHGGGSGKQAKWGDGGGHAVAADA
ncbi:hypothetical protein C8Q74DRAFT_558479 [Fomes fomentarius]|nr:hypothetical protein C8Q74DRAFT_558479 [Fomes fomentarius]